jgi:hypothetical protein
VGAVVGRPGAYRAGPGFYSARRTFSYHGRSFAAVRVRPYVYLSGYSYHPFYVGQVFPAALLISDYLLADYYLYNLSPPPGPGLEWVRWGPDALLVNTYTGQVVDTAPGVFDEDPGYADPGPDYDSPPPPGYYPPPPGYGPPPGYPPPGYPGPSGYPGPQQP